MGIVVSSYPRVSLRGRGPLLQARGFRDIAHYSSQNPLYISRPQNSNEPSRPLMMMVDGMNMVNSSISPT